MLSTMCQYLGACIPFENWQWHEEMFISNEKEQITLVRVLNHQSITILKNEMWNCQLWRDREREGEKHARKIKMVNYHHFSKNHHHQITAAVQCDRNIGFRCVCVCRLCECCAVANLFIHTPFCFCSVSFRNTRKCKGKWEIIHVDIRMYLFI